MSRSKNFRFGIFYFSNSHAREEHTLVDQQAELTGTKLCEMFAESLPSSVLQTYALLGPDTVVSKIAVTSIIVSASCIAFASSTISADWDTDPKKRLIAPNFYGYTPDKNRMMVFVLMTLMTCAHVLMKILACSLMLRLDKIAFVVYLAADMSLFWLCKILRGDLRYWIRAEGVMSWVITGIFRVVIKLITDFTLIIQFRHPFELGGAYWSFNVFSNQCFCFLSVHLFGTYSNNASEEVLEVLWQVVGGLFIFSMLNFGLFLKSINQEYLWSFFNTLTGKQFAVLTYHEAESDEMRFEIFGHHPSFYDSINEELMIWMNENWEKWEENKPEWFTADAIASVPADMLPVTVLEAMGGKDGRRKSIDAMKKENKELSKRKQSVRGADLKIIPGVVEGGED